MTDKLRDAAQQALEALKETSVECAIEILEAALAHQDAQNAADEVWRKLFWQAALKLKCLPSSYPDANGHVLRAIDRLMGSENAQQDAQPLAHLPKGCTHYTRTGDERVTLHFESEASADAWHDAQAASPTPPGQQDAQAVPLEPKVWNSRKPGTGMPSGVQADDTVEWVNSTGISAISPHAQLLAWDGDYPVVRWRLVKREAPQPDTLNAALTPPAVIAKPEGPAT